MRRGLPSKCAVGWPWRCRLRHPLPCVSCPPHDVAVDERVRRGSDEDVLGGGDERQRGRAVDAPRLEVGEKVRPRRRLRGRSAKSIIAEAAVGVEDVMAAV